jgi:hypothetical protein
MKNGNRSFTALSLITSLLIADISCTSNDDPAPVDCSSTDLAVHAAAVAPSSCSATDGTVTLSASGGTEPYQFSVNEEVYTSNPSFTGLGAGTYTVSVIDRNGCEAVGSATLQSAGSTLAITVSTGKSGCNTSNGSISVSVTGGTAPYEYRLNNDGFGTSTSFSALAANLYSITVKDAEGCLVTQRVRVESGISFQADIKGIIDTSCAKSGCHVQGGAGPINMTSFNTIKNAAAAIKARTQDGTMPKDGPPLTQAEKDKIACWVDDGAPNN